MKIYSIEGNIGSGKSTFLKHLKNYYKGNKHIIFLQEPVDNWNTIVDKYGVNILTKYYINQERYAFSFQMLAFITRLKQIKDILTKYSNKNVIIITERCIYTDREIFAKMLYDIEKIEDVEYTIYLKWFDYFVKDIDISGIIYLRTNPEVCKDRIKLRNRTGEEDITSEYLNELHRYHENWLKNGNVLTLDGSIGHDELNTEFNDYIFSDTSSNFSDILGDVLSDNSFSERLKCLIIFLFIPILNIVLISIPIISVYLK